MVVTYGMFSGNGLPAVQNMLKKKGARLAYGASIKMVDNYILLLKITRKSVKKRLSQYQEAINPILEDISHLKKNRIKKATGFINYINERSHITFANKDKYFTVSDACNHCGICVHVCPAQNIDLVDGLPIFNHCCEQCLACLHWCPRKAINWKNKTQKKIRYHHPEINYKDLP